MHTNTPSIDNLKEKAKLTQRMLKEDSNIDVLYSKCLELVSKLYGFKDWNSACAITKTKGPMPVNIRTVGQMKRVLAKFDDSLPLEMWSTLHLEGLIEVIDLLELTNEMLHDKYSLILDGSSADKASFQLKLENESLYTADGNEIQLPF